MRATSGSVPFTRIESRTWTGRAHLTSAAKLLLLFLVAAGSLLGQSFYGSIAGVIRDSRGGVVPNVKVTLIDQLTNLSRTTGSNDDGLYVFNQVVPSTYSVVAEVTGFDKFEHKGVIIST